MQILRWGLLFFSAIVSSVGMESSNEKTKCAYRTKLFWAAWWRAKRLSL